MSSPVQSSLLQELCQAIGPLDMVRITGPGIAEVTFLNKEDAMEAYKKYHHRNLDGVCSCMLLYDHMIHYTKYRPANDMQVTNGISYFTI